MKWKPIIIIAAIVVVVAVAAIIFFTSSAYTGYAAAFDKSNKITSTEYETSIKMTVDGQTTTATGRFMVRDITTKVNFVNEMDINGIQILQFSDGDYIYVDDGQVKQKFKIGEKVEQTQKEPSAFDLDQYIQEFSGLLDASKIKDLNIAEKLDSKVIEKITKRSITTGTEYTVTLATQLVNELFASIINSEMSGGVNPECTLKSLSYIATENKNGYIDSVAYSVSMEVTFPASLTGSSALTVDVDLQLLMKIVNPGTPAQFDLPDTAGF